MAEFGVWTLGQRRVIVAALLNTGRTQSEVAAIVGVSRDTVRSDQRAAESLRPTPPPQTETYLDAFDRMLRNHRTDERGAAVLGEIEERLCGKTPRAYHKRTDVAA